MASHALTKLWRSMGPKPSAICSHPLAPLMLRGMAAASPSSSSSQESAASSNDPSVKSTGETDTSSSSDVLHRSYGDVQSKPGRAADAAYKSGEQSEAGAETLESTGFDISKRTRPAGDE